MDARHHRNHPHHKRRLMRFTRTAIMDDGGSTWTLGTTETIPITTGNSCGSGAPFINLSHRHKLFGTGGVYRHCVVKICFGGAHF